MRRDRNDYIGNPSDKLPACEVIPCGDTVQLVFRAKPCKLFRDITCSLHRKCKTTTRYEKR